MSNYPPGMTTGRSGTDWKVPQMCEHGHVWTTPMFNELGGGFYVDEDNGPVCPQCGELETGNPDLAERAYNTIKEAGQADKVLHVGPEEPNYE